MSHHHIGAWEKEKLIITVIIQSLFIDLTLIYRFILYSGCMTRVCICVFLLIISIMIVCIKCIHFTSLTLYHSHLLCLGKQTQCRLMTFEENRLLYIGTSLCHGFLSLGVVGLVGHIQCHGKATIGLLQFMRG